MPHREPCLNPEQLTRAAFDVGASRLLGHASRCRHCVDQLREMSALREIALQLPDGAPTEEAADTVLARILEADLTAAPSLNRRNPSISIRAALVAAGILLCMGVAFALLHAHTSNTEQARKTVSTQTPAETFRASVHPNPDAKFSIADGRPDEIVRLTDGTITVHVEKLRPGERFRVVTGNAEVEVRGTTFEVSATDDRLTSVRVFSGLVEVRPQQQEKVLLRPGERWPRYNSSDADLSKVKEPNRPEADDRPESTRSRVRADSPLSTPKQSETDRVEPKPPENRSSVAAPPSGRRAAEAAFNEGWAAFSAGELHRAVRRFDAAYAADARSGFAEDAMFWKAVALDRNRDDRAAVRALTFFIDTYPRSRRTLEACAMLGWKLLNKGETERARQLFVRAQKSRSERVRKSAEQGLERLQTPQ